MKLNYKELSKHPFEMDNIQTGGAEFRMLVFTGERDDEQRPVFKNVLATDACKVVINNKEYWGILGMDLQTAETQWYNYNDCVSLENWAVLDRLLSTRFAWMQVTDPSIVCEVKRQARLAMSMKEG
ncbi:MAG: hypothetical protein ACI30I_06220 [Parabacteroides sp.]